MSRRNMRGKTDIFEKIGLYFKSRNVNIFNKFVMVLLLLVIVLPIPGENLIPLCIDEIVAIIYVLLEVNSRKVQDDYIEVNFSER